MDAKSPPILNIADVQYRPVDHGEKYAAKVGDVGARLGASKLGYNVCVVPAGKRAFPRHNHMANEEMFFVLEGAGEIIIGPDRFPIRQGDFIASPAGGADTAHQIVNTSGASNISPSAPNLRRRSWNIRIPKSSAWRPLCRALTANLSSSVSSPAIRA